MDRLQITHYGPKALLIQFAQKVDRLSLARCRGLLRCLDASLIDGLQDVTPSCCALLLEFGTARQAATQRDKLRRLFMGAEAESDDQAPQHEISICYDGPDLERLAACQRLSVSDVIDMHCLPVYSVFLIGFSPGFPYLGPLHPRLHVPRLDSPRARVPAGSVGIGGEHTGIYSIASPGGWWLIGRTNCEIFSLEQARGTGSKRAFLLRQGDLVKFRPIPSLAGPQMSGVR